MAQISDTAQGSASKPPAAPAGVLAPVSAGERLSALDFIRGIAVMGILAANIIAFGQPFTAYLYPAAFLVDPQDPGGWQWIAQFVLIDGKMRGLFTVLFGAGLYLFMQRAWARGKTRLLAFWRLVILGLFGAGHFFFIWIGDILLLYAIIGCLVLLCLGLSAAAQFRTGILTYLTGAVLYGAMFTFPFLIVDTQLGEAPQFAADRAAMIEGIDQSLLKDRQDGALKSEGDYASFVAQRIERDALYPLKSSALVFVELFPFMLIGMALYRFGFFSGEYDRAMMRRWGWAGLIIGAGAHLAIGLLVQAYNFSLYAVTAAFLGWSPLPKLVMVLGLLALLVDASQRANGWLAERIRAAGRAAFTNYLGTSIVMLVIFHGWGLGLFGELNRPQLYGVMLMSWAVMLVWSKPWLNRFHYGPLEWLWRCLTYRRFFAIKRQNGPV